MKFSTSDWHKRFQQQATWTKDFRSHLFRDVITRKHLAILEVGSGTGVITHHLHEWGNLSVFGVDISPERILFAKEYDTKSYFSVANGLKLPFSDGCFDITCCHYYLMWVSSPIDAVAEMARVTKTGGHIVVMAEPDYSKRNDLPMDLLEIGTLQSQALRIQGANPEIGGKVKEIFHELALTIEEAGMYQSDLNLEEKDHIQEEINILRNDLAFILDDSRISKFISRLENTFKIKNFHWSVPTHFVVGNKN